MAAFADDEKIEAFLPQKTTEVYKNDYIAFGEDNFEHGLIFYPGGKVEHTAYEPLMKELASEGILCVLVEMPLNFAIFGMNKAEDIIEEYDIDILSLEESMENAYISMGYSIEDKNLYNLINSLFNEGE